MSNRYLDWFRQAEADLRHARNSLDTGDFEVNGLPTPGSDVDLCLILTSSDKQSRDRTSDYLPLGFPVGIDLFAYTKDEFDRLKDSSPGWFDAINSGVEID